MDEVYEQAVKRSDELRSELETLSDFISLHRRARHLLGLDSTAQRENAPLGTSNSDASPHAQEPFADAPVKRSRVTDNPKPAAVVEASRRIIAARGRPMSRKELHLALAVEGLEVNGADPIKALGTMLWRARDELVQLSGLGYWLKDQPYDPAGYDPDPFFNTALPVEDETDVGNEVEFV